MTSEMASTALLIVLALTMITISVVSIARDADWWVITRDTARGHAEHAFRRRH